jgi:hypothetical protein
MRAILLSLPILLGLGSVASANELLRKGEQLIAEGRALVAKGEGLIREGKKLVELYQSKRLAAQTALDRALRMQREAHEMERESENRLSRGKFDRAEAQRDIDRLKGEIERLTRARKEKEEELRRARDLAQMGRDEMGKGEVQAGAKLLAKAQAQEKALGFRIQDLERQIRQAHNNLIRSVNRLRRAESDLYNGRALQARSASLKQQAQQALEAARAAAKAIR